MAAGNKHRIIITKSNRAYSLSDNNSAACSRESSLIATNHGSFPLELSLPNSVEHVACGYQHIVLLIDRGDVYTFGRGNHGQLGIEPEILVSELTREIHTAIGGPDGDICLFGDCKYDKLSYKIHSNEFEPCFINKFKEYNVLKVVCGDCQIIILAQKRSIDNEEDIESIFFFSDITNSKILLVDSHYLIMTNLTNTIDQSVEPFKTSNNTNHLTNSSLHIESNELSTSTDNLLLNTTHLERNGQLPRTSFKSKTCRKCNNDVTSTISIIQTTDDKTKLNLGFTSIDKLSIYNTKSTTNLRQNQTFTDEYSSSEDASISEQTSPRNSSDIRHTDPNKHTTSTKSSITKNYYQQISSDEIETTTSGRTSSSISSIHSETEIIYSKPINTIHPSENNSTKNLIETKSQIGLFSKIFPKKSSQNLLKTTNKNSRVCSIM